MQDHAKLSRLLQILIFLKSRYGKTISEISEYFDISRRTVYRYIETIKDAGFIVESYNGFYKIAVNNKEYRDINELLHFSSEESYILQRAIHSIDENNVLKETLVKKLYSLYNSRSIAKTILRNQLSENIHLLCDAIERKRQVILQEYSSAHAQKISDRIVEPFMFTTNYISVWCYDIKKRKNLLFKTVRIGKVLNTNDGWIYEKGHHAIPTDVFRIAMKKPGKVKILLTLRARNLLAEEYPLSESYIVESGGKYIFEGHVGSYEGIGRFVMGLMDEVEVIDPWSLKDFLNKRLEKKIF